MGIGVSARACSSPVTIIVPEFANQHLVGGILPPRCLGQHHANTADRPRHGPDNQYYPGMLMPQRDSKIPEVGANCSRGNAWQRLLHLLTANEKRTVAIAVLSLIPDDWPRRRGPNCMSGTRRSCGPGPEQAERQRSYMKPGSAFVEQLPGGGPQFHELTHD
jgi:hypothetical protein